MRFAVVFLAALLFLFQTLRFDVHAFTTGFLLPSYICGPPTDGLPKSLATYLPYVQRHTNPFGSNVSQPVRVDYATDQGTILNTQLLLANWHNRVNILGCNKTIFVNTSLVNNPAVVNQIVPGQAHMLTLIVNGNADTGLCDTHQNAAQVTANEIANIALDGAVLWAENTTTTVRLGNFTQFGANMQPWAACGVLNTGIVHNQLLSEVGTYTGIVWHAPANIQIGSTITFKGAAVTDVGFGKHATTLPVIAPTGAAAVGLAVTKPVINLIVEFGVNMVVFFSTNSKNAPAQNAPVVATSFTVVAIFNNGASKAQTTATASPAYLNIKAQAKGTIAKVTVTGNNPPANSTASNTVTYTVQGGATVVDPTKVDVNTILALCPGEVVTQRVLFGQDDDPDNQCAIQDQLVANLSISIDQATIINNTNTIIISSASQQSPALAVITLLALAVAALALKH